MFTSLLLSIIAGLAVLCYNLKIDKATLETSIKDKENRLGLLDRERKLIYNDYKQAHESLREQHQTELQNLKDKHLKDLEKVATLSAEISSKIILDKIEAGIAGHENKTSLVSLMAQKKTGL